MNDRKNLVARAQRAWKACPDTRQLKRELEQGNPYALALLDARGARYTRGAIVANRG